MRAVNLLPVTLVTLLAFAAARGSDTNDVNEVWSVGVENESSNVSEITDAEENDVTPHRARRSTCPGDTFNMSPADQRTIVELHNQIRGREGAANMRELRWSDELAKRAHQWATLCVWQHNLNVNCMGEPLGQNLFMTNGRSIHQINMTRVISSGWWSEKKFYTYSNDNCVKGEMCGHYKEVVRANRYLVGCSKYTCPKVLYKLTPWYNAVVVACDYQIVDIEKTRKGRDPFIKGQACSECNTVVNRAHKCKKGLCVECNPDNETGCKCIKLKCVHGTFDPSRCRCNCPSGFWGIWCSYPCKCYDKLRTCRNFTHKCRVPSWIDFMAKNCPASCPENCRKPPPGACK